MKKVVVWGLGAMGSGMARLVSHKAGFKLVGAIDSRPEYVGTDLAVWEGFNPSASGVKVSSDAERVLVETKPDITLVATNSFVDAVMPQLTTVLKAGSNCVTIAEELAYPWHSHPAQAHRLDELAKKHDVALLGTGVNPGFVLDALILMLTGVCSDVRKIHASRVNDLSAFGPTVMHTQGVGASLPAFYEGLKSGDIVGHVGFRQSIDMMADALGWVLEEIKEERIPIVSNVERSTPYITVAPGMVAGCNHVARGMLHGQEVITLEHPQQVHPHLENVTTGDSITITGTPDIAMKISPEIPGGKATMNLAVNMLLPVSHGPRGLRTMLDYQIPRYSSLG